jgi:nucleoside-triphosphatase THEP1
MKVMIVSGERGEGKTTFLKKLSEELINRKSISLAGFYAENIKDEQGREGYMIVNPASGKQKLLCKRESPETGNLHLLDFWFDEEALKVGEQWLLSGIHEENPVFLLDEAGKFELDGHVWDAVLKKLLQHGKGTLVVAVRNKFVEKVVEKYQLNHHQPGIINNLLFTVELADEIECR